MPAFDNKIQASIITNRMKHYIVKKIKDKTMKKLLLTFGLLAGSIILPSQFDKKESVNGQQAETFLSLADLQHFTTQANVEVDVEEFMNLARLQLKNILLLEQLSNHKNKNSQEYRQLNRESISTQEEMKAAFSQTYYSHGEIPANACTSFIKKYITSQNVPLEEQLQHVQALHQTSESQLISLVGQHGHSGTVHAVTKTHTALCSAVKSLEEQLNNSNSL